MLAPRELRCSSASAEAHSHRAADPARASALREKGPKVLPTLADIRGREMRPNRAAMREWRTWIRPLKTMVVLAFCPFCVKVEVCVCGTTRRPGRLCAVPQRIPPAGHRPIDWRGHRRRRTPASAANTAFAAGHASGKSPLRFALAVSEVQGRERQGQGRRPADRAAPTWI